ncbi:DCL family protein [Streptomyces geranii]|uniref:DCL family protein n=1 Tax=Streptomyces geranii TaxID=2058923 RepID=UPI000D02FC2F|nr:DCL family protein [Streptomyces geranii]
MAVFWIGQRRFATKGAARAAVQEVLHGYPVGTVLSGEVFDLLRDLLDMHPDAEDKIGVGVADIRIAPSPHPKYKKYPAFEVVRTDESTIDFSYRDCIDHPSLRSQVHNVMRVEVEDKTTAYFESRLAEETFVSDESGRPLQLNDTAVSYFRGPSFAQIADGFAATEGGWEVIELTPSTQQGLGQFADRDQAGRWRAHWEDRAILGLLTTSENRTRPRS